MQLTVLAISFGWHELPKRQREREKKCFSPHSKFPRGLFGKEEKFKDIKVRVHP